MFSPRRCLWITFACVIFAPVASTSAQRKALSRFASYRTIEADPSKDYVLAESNGPWMILAASFAGPTAENEARQLVMEFRKRFKWPAYLYTEAYDFSSPVEGRGFDKYGQPKKMRYRQQGEFTEYAVLVGDFPSVNDPQLQVTLTAIKECEPTSLQQRLVEQKQSSLRFAGLRGWYRQLTSATNETRRGPLSQAFVSRNPLLPQEYFTPAGIDSFVEEINRGVQYSLLDCPTRYSVKVATFRGNVIIDQKQVKEVEQTGRMEHRLTQAAEKAHRLTELLRERGVEAYEFHDRTESIVTVGSFASVGAPRQDGKIEIDPRVLKVMENYSARQTGQTIGGQPGLKPRSLGGIGFDIQPMPVEIPRRSIAADYSRRPVVR